MKINLTLLFFTFLISFSVHALSTTTIDEVFQKNKVKVYKTEVVNDETIYTVELPFDPSIGRNSSQLEAELVEANGCKSLSLISNLDEIKIHVLAKKNKKGCVLKEEIKRLSSK